MTTPNTPNAAERIGPRQLDVRFTCEGCPALKTEEWKDYLDNDETDSGTRAVCSAADGKGIDRYWSRTDPPPTWRPARELDSHRPAESVSAEPEPFLVGNRYRTQAGDIVLFVAVHNKGTRYETMEDEAGVNRYTRRDFGRVTGSEHDYSDPRNTPPLYLRPQPSASASAPGPVTALAVSDEDWSAAVIAFQKAHALWRKGGRAAGPFVAGIIAALESFAKRSAAPKGDEAVAVDFYSRNPSAALVDFTNRVAPPAQAVSVPERRGIYVASRVHHADMWKRQRMFGVAINSTWIDEAGEGETGDFAELWARIESEIAKSTGLVLYAEQRDFPLKGALVEVGMALAHGVPVFAVLPHVELAGRTMRPVGSWLLDARVTRTDDLGHAIDLAAAPAAATREGKS